MTEPSGPESRADRKERTRRAILDAALRLTGEAGLSGVSLRQVAKEVGIVPTAFYRHFDSIDALGLALVEESMVSLRAMLRDVRRPQAVSAMAMVDESVRILAAHVHEQQAHFAFIARERTAAPGRIRDAIRHELDLCERELATDLARLDALRDWPAGDLQAVSSLVVSSMVAIAEAILSAPPEQEAEIAARAATQLRMILVGAVHWQPSAGSGTSRRS